MGGSVAVTLREDDGTQHRMCRWTNALSHWICNVKMFEKNPKHVRAFVDEWYKMYDDYIDNKHDGNFKYPMTECYATHPYLAPEQYGLVVVDFKTNHILSMQGYTSLNQIYSSSIEIEVDEMPRFKALFKKKRAVKFRTFKSCGESIVLNPKLEEIPKWNEGYGYIEIDTKPFTYIRYEENAAGIKKMLAKVKELGFNLSKEELKLWNQFRKDSF